MPILCIGISVQGLYVFCKNPTDIDRGLPGTEELNVWPRGKAKSVTFTRDCSHAQTRMSYSFKRISQLLKPDFQCYFSVLSCKNTSMVQ